MNIGIAGFRHDHIYAVLQWAEKLDGMSITAAWEQDAAAREAAEQRGFSISHDSFASLVSDPELDLIAIGDYYGARGEEVRCALEHGKHVLVDKPICTSRDELARIRSLASEKNRIVGMMLDLRFAPAFRTAKRLVDEGVLGKLHNAMICGAHPLMWGERPGWYFEDGKHGGTINDIAVHGVDMLRILTGKRLSRVVGARTWNGFAVQAPQFHDCAQFVYMLEDGFGVAGDVSYSAPPWAEFSMPQYWRTTVWGEKAVMEFDASNKPVQLIRHGAKTPEYVLDDVEETNPLKETVRAIRGEPSLIDPDGAFDSSEDTLLLQEAADRSVYG